MAKKTTPAERKKFIEEQRAKPSCYGARAVFPRDMSFIDREGNIVRPNEEDYRVARAKREGGATRTTSRYHASSEQEDMSPPRTYELGRARKRYQSVIATIGILAGIFFLSFNLTGNAIADLTTKTTSFLGAGLLILGLVAGFFLVKSRKK